MENLVRKSNTKIYDVTTKFSRYLLSQITEKNRLTIVKGARGVGKTTLLLQYAKKQKENGREVLYVALDDLFFQENTLYDLAIEFVKYNGQFLLLDEVHKYPNWSRELKLIYDDLPKLNLFVTSSSILEIYESESDLSRRAVSFLLKELSFREFLIFEQKLSINAITLDELISDHEDISFQVNQKIKPLYEFKKYLEYGMYPYYWENPLAFSDKLIRTLHLSLEVDLPAVEFIEYYHILKLKKLLFAISTSVPFTPNISKLSERIGMSRKALIKALHYLDRARLITLLAKSNKGISILGKPDKILMNNPNIQKVLHPSITDFGAVRESFLVHQIKDLYEISMPPKGDFWVNEKYTLEVGGKHKSRKQIKDITNAYVVKDNIETGVDQVIPLWMFGLLY